MDEQAEATARAYDSAALDFADRTSERSALASEFFDLFLDTLEPGSRVGDLGCGPGHDLRRLLSAGHRAVGVDRSPGLLALCPVASECVLGDLRALPVAEGSLEAIWSSAALLHIDSSDIAATFAEWDRVLVPGGTVGFATSLGGDEGWELMPAGPGRRPEIAAGHQRWFVHHTEQALRAAVADVGWTIESSVVRESTRSWVQIIAATVPAV